MDNNNTYSTIEQIFFDYIDKQEYSTNDFVLSVDKLTGEATSKAIEYARNNDIINASDTITHALFENEKRGFILGFRYAMRLSKEI